MTQMLGEMLLAAGVVDADQLREALVYHRDRRIKVGEALVQLGYVDEPTVFRALAKQQGMPFVDLSGNVGQEILDLVPEEIARDQRLVPVIEKGGALIVAVDDPSNRIVADQLQFQLGRDVRCALSTPTALREALLRYGAAEEAAPSPRPKLAVARATTPRSSGSIVAHVRRRDRRCARGTSTSSRRGTRCACASASTACCATSRATPRTSRRRWLNRLKVMGSMDIAEKRKPQDRRIEVDLGGRPLDVRCSILPSDCGETIVGHASALSGRRATLSLRDLGLDADDQKWFDKLISRPNGIVLVTGPTGSGKTTSLYAALQALNRPDVKIITAEDPVEYHISGINQVQVNKKVGLSFARILRAMLRAAPNVILVGEIRDLETAEVAVQAALTGHLVFSTLHTNDAPSAITRLIDMGIQPFLASAAVQGVMAQHLVAPVLGVPHGYRRRRGGRGARSHRLGGRGSARSTDRRLLGVRGLGLQGSRRTVPTWRSARPAAPELIFEGHSLEKLRHYGEVRQGDAARRRRAQGVRGYDERVGAA
ncbi:MAG: ATPase, T2SS/T4P/T4SS family [Planctomycetota bacterium]